MDRPELDRAALASLAAERIRGADWNAAHLEFAHPSVADYLAAMDRLAAQGRGRFHLADDGDPALREAVRAAAAAQFGPAALAGHGEAGPDLVEVSFESEAQAVSDRLLRQVDRPAGLIVQRTAHHCSARPIILVAVPKSGFHLVSRLLSDMGIAHGGRWTAEAKPQHWYTVFYDHPHLTAPDLFTQLAAEARGGADAFIFQHPVIFAFRHPCDIVISEARYYAEEDATAVARYYAALPEDRRMSELIVGSALLGSLRARIVPYLPWIELKNVLPVPFEDIVGAKGGGEDALQMATIWALQLKLQVAGQPQDYARHLFGESNRTFRRGRIGTFQEIFEDEHYDLIGTLSSLDFIKRFGYRLDRLDRAAVFSQRSDEFRARAVELVTPRAEAEAAPADDLEDEQLYRCRGYYLARVRGRYCAIEPGQPVFDPFRDPPAARWHIAATLAELLRRLDEAPLDAGEALARAEQPAFEQVFRARLVVHTIEADVNQFSILRMGQRYFAVPHRLGPLDIAELQVEALPEVIAGEDLEAVRRQALAVVNPPRLMLRDFHDHNVVEYRGRFFGLPRDIGAVDVAAPGIERDGRIVVADDIGAVKQAILRQAMAQAGDQPPRLVREDFHGFNLVLYAGAYHAIPRAAGAVDLTRTMPADIPGCRSAPSQEEVTQLVLDLVQPPDAPAPLGDAGKMTDWLHARSEALGRRQVQAAIAQEAALRAMAREIDGLKAEIAALRAAIERR